MAKKISQIEDDAFLHILSNYVQENYSQTWDHEHLGGRYANSTWRIEPGFTV